MGRTAAFRYDAAMMALCAKRLWRSASVGWLLSVLLGWLALVGVAQAQTQELTQARASVTVNGATTIQNLQLPYHWDRFNKGQRGEAVFDLPFDLPESPVDPWGLYLPRLGNAYEIWLNGTLLQRQGDLLNYNGADYARVPRYVALSPALLRSSNLIRVHIRADVGRRGGLSALVVGPQEAVYAAYLRNYHWRGTGSLVVMAFSLVVGLMALSLWVTQTAPDHAGRTRRDPLYLFAGLAELFWTLAVSDTLIENPPVPWPWWGALQVVVLGAWGVNMALFCVEVAGWGRRPAALWFRRWLGLLMAASVGMAAWALGGGEPLALTLWYAVLGATLLSFGVFFLWQALRQASTAHRVVAVALLINVLFGLRDLYVFRINPTYAANTLLRYSSVLFGLGLGYIVIARFRTASAQARDLLATLAARVSQKEVELAESYRILEILAREQERTAERTRILRDMHDGVGSHISSAIRQLQSGRVSQQELLQTLRDTLDQLKLSIDTMNLPPGDVTALLANLRYRLEPRLAASDIELQWGVDLLEPVRRLDAQAMRQLQFMVFEALSNVLQHAHASVLRIEATMTPQGTRLRLVDNGCGFDATAPLRKGLQSMRERAQAIGATLSLHSTPGQTVVEILIA
ncbi:MAG: histidine kinase [Polaromonas sp.]|nr:histidine kinase [Polaromonas sp.]